MTKQELDKVVQEYRKLSTMAEEAQAIAEAEKQKIIQYMTENGLTEEFTDSAKITYLPQSRETLDRKRLENDLGDLSDYTKVSTFNVLRIK